MFKRICRICGKEYEACATELSSNGEFTWHKVACSPACGSEYFRQVAESRGEVYPASFANESEKEDLDEAELSADGKFCPCEDDTTDDPFYDEEQI